MRSDLRRTFLYLLIGTLLSSGSSGDARAQAKDQDAVTEEVEVEVEVEVDVDVDSDDAERASSAEPALREPVLDEGTSSTEAPSASHAHEGARTIDGPLDDVSRTAETPADEPTPSTGARAAPSAAHAQTDGDRELSSLRARVAALEARLARDESAPRSLLDDVARDERPWWRVLQVGVDRVDARLTVGGYVQAQALLDQLSEDRVQQGGVPMNRDGVSVRRARARLAFDWSHGGAELEIDANTSLGPSVSARRATVFVHVGDGVATIPWARLRVGLTEMPFGLELTQLQEDRFFMERTVASEALFPGPTDVGVRFDGQWSVARYDVALMNGTPVDDGSGAFARDPTQLPDLIGRLGADLDLEWLRIGGGGSFLAGQGFTAGEDAGKNHLIWRDLNENGRLDTGEVAPLPARGATPSFAFPRFAAGVDAFAVFSTWIGTTRAFGELGIASNLDRGLYVADPVFAGRDLREVFAHVAVVQDVTAWAFFGLRAETYNGDLDLLESRVGARVPVDASIHTLSPLVGARVGDALRVSAQFDAVFDSLGRDDAGVPRDLDNNRLTVRVQGRL